MEASTDPFHQKFRTTSVRASRQGNDPEIQSFQFSKAGIIKKKSRKRIYKLHLGLFEVVNVIFMLNLRD